MFVESLVESTPLLRSRNRFPALISIAAQAALVAVILAIPLLYPEVLPTAVRLATLAPPRPPAPVPPVVDRPHVVPAVANVPAEALAAPSPMSAAVRAMAASDEPPVDSPALAIGTTRGPADAALPAAMVGSTPPATVVHAAASRPLRISEGVTAGMLLAPIQPVYPQMAKLTRTSGTVVVEAVISKAGKIESAHAVSGPAMLQGAAVDAVRAARYRPFLLNGEATEVETRFDINFRMQ